MPGIQQALQRGECRVVGSRHAWPQVLADMVDDHRHRQRAQPVRVLRQLPAVELDLHVPAEGADARDHRVQIVPAQRAAGQQVEAHAPCMHRLQRCFIDVRAHDDHAARRGAEGGQRLEHAAVVVAVSVGLHHHHALQPQARLQRAVAVDAGQRRAGLRRVGKVRLEQVHVAVAGAVGQGPARVGRHAQARQAARRVACAALTAPAGHSPLRSAASWATVSSAWCSAAGGVSPPMCGVAITLGCAASAGEGI